MWCSIASAIRFSFDQSIPKADQIYRVVVVRNYTNGTIQSYATTPFPLAEAIGQEYAYVEKIWLKQYVYRVQIELPMVLLICSTSLIIILATISLKSLKAALENPVKALKSE